MSVQIHELRLRGWGCPHAHDDEEAHEHSLARTWRNAQKFLKHFEYLDTNGKVCLEFDWHSALENAANVRAVRPRSVKIASSGASVNHINPIVDIVYDCFLAFNLTRASSLDLGGASLVSGAGYSPKLDVSSEALCSIYHHGRFDLVKPEGDLELGDVVRWLRACKRPYGQIATTPSEQCLYGLLYILKDTSNLNSVAWIFYSLESFYQTSPGTSQSALRRRIASFLEVDERTIANALKPLLKRRHSFIHGGFQAIHPHHNDILDDRMYDPFSELVHAIEVGVALIVESLRQAIRKDWAWPVFEETMTGKSAFGCD